MYLDYHSDHPHSLKKSNAHTHFLRKKRLHSESEYLSPKYYCINILSKENTLPRWYLQPGKIHIYHQDRWIESSIWDKLHWQSFECWWSHPTEGTLQSKRQTSGTKINSQTSVKDPSMCQYCTKISQSGTLNMHNKIEYNTIWLANCQSNSLIYCLEYNTCNKNLCKN